MTKPQKRDRWNRTSGEIAAILGVSEDTVHNYVKAGAPKLAHNQYDERLFIPWVIEQYKKRDTATLAEEQARLTKNKADLAELELAEKRGEVVRRADVSQKWERTASIIRARFLALPAITQDVVSAPTLPESQKVIEDAVWNILAELSGGGPIPDASPDTAPTHDRKPVGGRKPRVKPRVKRGTRKVEHVEG